MREVNTGTPVLVAEFDNSEFVKLNDGPMIDGISFDGMDVSVSNNLNGDFKYVTKDGRGGIYVPAINDGFYISVNIDDEKLYGGVNDITVYVDYFDEGNGNFDVAYDKGNYEHMYPTNNVVYLENTGEWKTAKFNINSSWLENHSFDFRIALWTGNMTTSPEGIIFGGIRVENNLENPDFNLSYDDIDNLIIRDKNGKILKSEQIEVIDYFDVSTNVLSNYDDMELCMVAAVYDEKGRMCSVSMIESDAVAGEKSELKTSVSLSSEIEEGYKIKILMLKNVTSIIPFTNAHIITAK